MNIDELLQEANDGNMVAQYDLAEYYGKLLKDTENEEEIYNYSRQAMIWLKKSAKQGYGPALDAVNELNMRQDDDAGAAAVGAAATAGAAADVSGDTRRVPSEQVAQAAAASAAKEAKEKAEKPPKPPKPPKQNNGGGYFSSTTHIIIVCMLVVSLLINILLLVFLFRMVGDDKPDAGNNIVEVSPTPAATPEPTPQPTPEPTPEATPEPTPEVTPEPTPEPFWLDLSAYSYLEVVPAQKDIYDDYSYFAVTADDTLNMRTGPDTKYKKIGEIPSETKVGAVSQSGNWYLVYYKEQYGWVSGDYLTTNLNYQRPSGGSTSSGSGGSTSSGGSSSGGSSSSGSGGSASSGDSGNASSSGDLETW